MLHNENKNLEWVLKHKTIQTHFQPIVSIRKQTVIGFEALSRGLSADNTIIMPLTLFAEAAAQGKSVEFDRLCREKALKNFKPLARQNPESFLFLNLNTAILDAGIVGSGHIINTVNQIGLHPSSIVIEILESKVNDIENLTRFIKLYRQYGFLIALDDVGSASSNLDRVLQVHPDIIKIDRGLIMSINTDYYKQELFKALVFAAKKTGALVIAEGVDSHAEAVTCLELGADFLQGYYIAYPSQNPANLTSALSNTLKLLSSSYRNTMVNKIRNAALAKNFYEIILEGLAEKLSCTYPANFEILLSELTIKPACVQCYYLLDINGIQITETIKAPYTIEENQHRMFRPGHAGTDQSLKDYYLNIYSGYKSYISEPYISLANGLPCITGSMLFQTSSGTSYILCVDFYLLNN